METVLNFSLSNLQHIYGVEKPDISFEEFVRNLLTMCFSGHDTTKLKITIIDDKVIGEIVEQ